MYCVFTISTCIIPDTFSWIKLYYQVIITDEVTELEKA